MSIEKRLKIQLLGPPKLFWDGRPLEIQRRMARVLLYYLAVHKEICGRDQVLDDFWPEKDNQRQRLRDILSKLRSELPDAGLVVTDRDLIGLDHTRSEVDVLEFEDLFRQTTLPFLAVENRPLPEPIFQKMVQAVNLWQSPNFIAGLGLLDNEDVEVWTRLMNQRLQGMRLDLMMRISMHLINSYNFEEALKWLEQVIELDLDYNLPQAVSLKVDVLFRLQRWPQAYEFAMQAIKELGLDWFAGYAVQLESLVEQMENLQRRKPEITPISPQTLTSQHIQLDVQDHLIQNIATLTQRGGILFLQGESGSGKTHLLKRLVSLDGNKNRWLYLSANFFQKDQAFYPLIDALRMNLQEKDWRSLDSFWGAQLTPLFPETQQFWNLSPGLEFVQVSYQISIYEAIYNLFLKLALDRRLGIVLDDAHWADVETLNFLIYLAQRGFFKEHGFLILAVNPEIDHPLLQSLILRQYEIEPFSLLQIEPLNHDGIAQIGFTVFGKKIHETLVQRISKACGGNILFVIETLRAFIALHGVQDEYSIERLPVPAAVHAILRNRLLSLPLKTHTVLECAAVIGDPFTYHNVLSALEIDEITLVSALEELQNRAFIMVESSPFISDKYFFKLGFLRDVTTLETSLTRKQLFHWRLAKLFEQDYEKTHNSTLLSKIAIHYSEAGETTIAFEYWIRLAQHQYIREHEYSTQEAYQNARHIANSFTEQLSTRQLYSLYIGWGEQALFQHELAIADDCFKQAIIIGQKRSDSLMLGAGYSGMGAVYSFNGLPNQAQQYLDQAENFLQNEDFGERIRVRTRKSELMINHNMLREGIRELENLSADFQQASTPSEHFNVAEAKITQAMGYILTGELEKADQLRGEIREVLKVHRNLPLQSRLSLLTGRIAYLRGQYGYAAEQFGLSIQFAELYSAWDLALKSATFASQVALNQGKVFHCLEQINNSRHLSELYHYKGVLSNLNNAQGRAFLFLGLLSEAGEYFENGISFNSSKYEVLTNQKGLGIVQFLSGEREKGVQNINEVIQTSKVYGYQMIAHVAQMQLILLQYDAGLLDSALSQLQTLESDSTMEPYGGKGSGLAYVTALEAISTHQYEQADEAIKKLLQEESLWLTWHAYDLRRQNYLAQGINRLEDQIACENCIQKIRHMIPKDMRKTIVMKRPPLAVLV